MARVQAIMDFGLKITSSLDLHLKKRIDSSISLDVSLMKPISFTHKKLTEF